jgi:hypothetical protein
LLIQYKSSILFLKTSKDNIIGASSNENEKRVDENREDENREDVNREDVKISNLKFKV